MIRLETVREDPYRLRSDLDFQIFLPDNECIGEFTPS